MKGQRIGEYQPLLSVTPYERYNTIIAAMQFHHEFSSVVLK